MAASKSSHSVEITKRLERAEYPDDVIDLVTKLRAAAYTTGGADLLHVFHELDTDHSGSLDFEQFKLVLPR